MSLAIKNVNVNETIMNKETKKTAEKKRRNNFICILMYLSIERISTSSYIMENVLKVFLSIQSSKC